MTAASQQLGPDVQPEESHESGERWSPLQRTVFRFAFCYSIAYLLPFPLSVFDTVSEAFQKPWDILVPWVGMHILQISYPINIIFNGSGDRTYDYVALFCYAVLAALATVTWSIADRRSAAYPRLHEWLRIYIRFGLGSILLGYGAAKLIKSQFPDPFLNRLMEPYGHSSPMGLLWTMMGYSASYNIYAGAAEFIPGLLLYFRRTTTLGALLAAATMSNIVMLNLSYDVPVKQFSMHLLAMALFLLVPEIRRLADFFLFNRAVSPAASVPRLGRIHGGRLGFVAWLAFVLYTPWSSIRTARQNVKQIAAMTAASPLRGLYEVEEHAVNRHVLPPTLAETSRWRYVIGGRFGTLDVRFAGDSVRRYFVAVDSTNRLLTLRPAPGQSDTASARLSYSPLDSAYVALEGSLGRDSIRVRLRKTPPPPFLLLTRGFRWINEVPFNR